MKLLTVFAVLLAIFAMAFGASIKKDDKAPEEHRKEEPKDTKNIKTFKTANTGRQARQLGIGGGMGYGGRLAGLQSQLQGISSGYGYGYNNAVGLGGLGVNNGYGLALPFGGLLG
ncbi:uncharacterized protein LOC129596860 [Paramacrobiotus metropolitanus]|uniref:uncharacterized protein LOC129596860 n=1 Tax=Paramacrobiotus metropolitanus TaxID=2943436 RepID=UPI002445E1BF|nr:uncharacterized protein LOC129596860 [Paramacrobiotus metropolitanus]